MKFKILRIVIACFLSFLATASMSYITLAAPIGPWIEMTLVLCSMLIFACIKRYISVQLYKESVGLTTIAGGIGGILATGMAFSFPTIYFAQPDLFRIWIECPLFFMSIVSCLALLAGAFGFFVAFLTQDYLLKQQQLSFPIGELVYKTIGAQGQLSRARELIIGFIATLIGLYTHARAGIFPARLTLTASRTWGIFSVPSVALTLDQLPLYIAVGFVTGHVIALPLIAGLIAKIAFIEPLYYIIMRYTSTTVTITDFTLAFSSGLVLYGALSSFSALFKRVYKLYVVKKTVYIPSFLSGLPVNIYSLPVDLIGIVSLLVLAGSLVLFFSFFGFSFLAQLFIILGTSICVYQLLVLAGRIGIAPLGRFATFIMVPGIVLFGFTPVQATLVSAFVEIAGGVASDVLCGQKLALLSSIEQKRALRYQLLGLIVSSCLIGLLFWLLLSYGGIGPTGQFAASKAASRALLITVKQFHTGALFAGIIGGVLISFTHLNSALMLGGILMAPEYILALSIGGILTYIVQDRERYYPFWSGVFTAHSLWMIIKAFFYR